jgi:hypothetical protein
MDDSESGIVSSRSPILSIMISFGCGGIDSLFDLVDTLGENLDDDTLGENLGLALLGGECESGIVSSRSPIFSIMISFGCGGIATLFDLVDTLGENLEDDTLGKNLGLAVG